MPLWDPRDLWWSAYPLHLFVRPGPGRVWMAPIRDGRMLRPNQVQTLTQFYSVDFSQSRISVKKCVFNTRIIKVAVFDRVL